MEPKITTSGLALLKLSQEAKIVLTQYQEYLAKLLWEVYDYGDEYPSRLGIRRLIYAGYLEDPDVLEALEEVEQILSGVV